MVYTDTHTHFYYETDEGKQAEMLQRCLDNNISRLFLPNVDASSVELMFNIVDRWPENFFPMLGLHPCDVKLNWQEELEKIKTADGGRKIYAIGEIGIDLYWDKTLLAEQLQAFEQQINWAKELDLPIVIHCRDAFDETYEVLQRLNDDKLRGIFHCFSGTVEQAQQVIDLGFYLGIGGVVTYKNAGLDKVVAQIDLKHLVLETDSPYLAPIPYRGKRNESSYVVNVINKLAEIYNVSPEKIAEITTENSKVIFGI